MASPDGEEPDSSKTRHENKINKSPVQPREQMKVSQRTYTSCARFVLVYGIAAWSAAA